MSGLEHINEANNIDSWLDKLELQSVDNLQIKELFISHSETENNSFIKDFDKLFNSVIKNEVERMNRENTQVS